MRPTHKLIGTAVVVVALGGIGTTAALAQTSTSKPHVNAPTNSPADTTKAPASPQLSGVTLEPTSPTDTDNLQQGDQNAPDATGTQPPGTNEKSTSTESDKTESAAPENNNDGPSGHQDANGNVDHQFDGQE